jgi:hypothetical protein
VILAELDFRVILVLAVVVVIAIGLGVRLLSRDRDVRRTRYGFFVERDRYDDEPEPPPELEDTQELEPPDPPGWQ